MVKLAFTHRLFCVAFVFALATSTVVQAQDAAAPESGTEQPATGPAEGSSDEPSDADKEIALDISQQALLTRFVRFEREMIQMAGQLRQADPERADLLIRANSRSQQEQIVGQMRQLLTVLAQESYGPAKDRQKAVLLSLKALLEVLQSENRMGEIEKERARILSVLRDVNKIIGQEKDARAINERGSNADRAAGKQEDVEKNTSNLIDKVKKQDDEKQANDDGSAQDGKPSQGKPGSPSEGKPGEPSKGQSDDQQGDKNDKPKDPEDPNGKDPNSKDPDDKQPGDKPEDGQQKKPGDPSDSKPKGGDPKSGKPSEGMPSDGMPSEGMPPEDGMPQDGKPQQGKPGQQPQPGQKPQNGQQGDQQDQQQQKQTPGREELEQARTEMEKAIEELRKKQSRDGASKHQDEAIRKLLEAKEKLEEILRQLREEEKELMLANLEARFRKMLGMQLLVYQQTVKIDQEKSQDSTLDTSKRTRQLSFQEDEIVREVGKALVLLQTEGSSVAFPQAVEAIQEDAAAVTRLLNKNNVGELTQTIEQGIIEALEEMIDALQKEMEKLDEKKEQEPQEQQQGQPQDDPLVDKLSELKMLRSLQLRINRLTRRLGRQIEGDQAEEPELLKQLRTLARRQEKIQAATYDLATGKNQ